MNAPITVLLADDHRILVDALRQLIDGQPDMKVVAIATDVSTAIAELSAQRPQVAVLDVSMPEGGGFEVLRRIKELDLPTKVVMLTMHGEDQHVMEAVRLGASGYVLKRSADKDLLDAIRAVARGDAYLTPAAVRLLLTEKRSDREPVLSPREREVLRLTARGHSNAEIAGRLFVSTKTVDTYRARVMTKLGLHKRSELVEYALSQGLLEPVG